MKNDEKPKNLNSLNSIHAISTHAQFTYVLPWPPVQINIIKIFFQNLGTKNGYLYHTAKENKNEPLLLFISFF